LSYRLSREPNGRHKPFNPFIINYLRKVDHFAAK
jgi:hypothetical protein